MPRGTIFPPNFATPEDLGFQWASEGDLVSKMQATHGDEATIAAFKAHRDAYLQQTDLDKLKSLAGAVHSHAHAHAHNHTFPLSTQGLTNGKYVFFYWL